MVGRKSFGKCMEYQFDCARTYVWIHVSNMEEAEALRSYLFQVYNTYFIVHQLQGRIYTRLSAQIYLEQTDFELFGNRVLEFVSRQN